MRVPVEGNLVKRELFNGSGSILIECIVVLYLQTHFKLEGILVYLFIAIAIFILLYLYYY